MNQKNMMEEKLQQMQAGTPLEMDATFYFECAGCGRCCYGHDDIMLTGYDIFRMAKHLEIPPGDVIRKYCIVMLGSSSHMPIVILGQMPNGACPLLKDNKCSVHQAKLFTCSLYPLGKISDPMTKTAQYVLQNASTLPPGCEHKNVPHTLRDWLWGSGIDDDSDGLAWHNAIFTIMDTPFMEVFREQFDFLTEQTCQIIIGALLSAMYTKYDTAQPYAPQLKANIQQIEHSFRNLHDTCLSASL